ncbi:MAG: MFS transporter [Leptospirales bacterium]|nr:MFS transporter [Leptospirales bacterium]
MRNPYLILASVAVGLFMVVMDVTILNVALPTLARQMQASLSQIQWTGIAYTLTLTGLVPVFGRISDVIGRKFLFISGLLVFSFSSLACAASPGIYWLVAARVLQASGGALISSNTLAIITDTFPEGRRGLAMGLQAILISGGAALGPSLGGFLVTNFGWHAVFLINAPIGLLSAAFALWILPPLRAHRNPEPIDWRGAALLVLGLGSFLLGITRGPEWGWQSPLIVALLLFGLGGLILFLWLESRLAFPLIHMDLFRIRAFVAGQSAGLFATMSLGALLFLLPFYWQDLRGYSAQSAGLLILPMPLTLMIVAPLAGRLSDALGTRGIATAGLALIALAFALLRSISETSSAARVVSYLMVFGAGYGMFMAPNNNAVMSSIPPARRGIAAGLLGMFRYIGQSMGIAFSGTIFAMAGGYLLPEQGNTAHYAAAFLRGMHLMAAGAIPLAVCGAVLSFLRGGKSEPSSASG